MDNEHANALAKARMEKFALFAKDSMPEICIFSEIRNGKQIYLVVSGGPLTKENTDAALMALAGIQKQKGWL